MALIINATEENITIQVAGNYFNWKPGQEKTIRSPEIAQFIQTERRGFGLAILPDVLTAEEDAGDVEVTAEELAERRKARDSKKKEACELALQDYIKRLRGVIANNQVYLRQDAARKGLPEGYEDHEISDGELAAMRTVAKYDRKGKDAAQAQVDEVRKLKEQLKAK